MENFDHDYTCVVFKFPSVVEGFEYSNDPRSYVVRGLLPLVGSPKENRS